MTSLRKEFSTARSNYFEQPLVINYDGLEESAKDNYRYYADTVNGFKYSDFPDQKQAENFINAGKFFEVFSKDTSKYRDTTLKYKCLNYMDTLRSAHTAFSILTKDPHIKQTMRSTDFYLNAFEQSKKEYVDNHDLTHKSSLEWMLLFIAPYLLAAAIAIRLTKVTAEIKELK